MSIKNLAIKDEIIKAALPSVPFDGWTIRTLKDAAVKAGYDQSMAEAVFPDGVKSAIAHFSDLTNRMMLQELKKTDQTNLRVRDKIALAVETRLDALEPHKEAERMAIAYFTGPFRKADAAKLLWKTSDVIWVWAGDTATDYNRYTKRALLSAVIGSTMLAWLNDFSDGHFDTRAFLARRIENTLSVGQTVGKIVGRFKKA